MKTYSNRRRHVLILMTTCLFLGGYTAGQAMSSDAQSRRIALLQSGRVQPVNDASRLIIWRDPGLGFFVYVNLYIDGVPVTPIGYGRSYEGFLSPGRHVLSVLPSPDPKWRTPWQMTLDARSGRTYAFTAIGNSGYLILRPPGLPELPRGR
jgi:hypothetical protein